MSARYESKTGVSNTRSNRKIISPPRNIFPPRKKNKNPQKEVSSREEEAETPKSDK